MTETLFTAQQFVAQAAEYVGGDRARTHGDKGKNFRTTAILWQAYEDAKREAGAGDLERPMDFALKMVLAKMSRILSGEYNQDDFVDMAGYAGCAGEVARAALDHEWVEARHDSV